MPITKCYTIHAKTIKTDFQLTDRKGVSVQGANDPPKVIELQYG